MKKLFVFAAGAAVATSANAFILDDFTSGAYAVTLSAVGSSDLAFQAAAVPGGFRGTYLEVISNPLNRDVTLEIDLAGFAVIDTGTMLTAYAEIGYGFIDDGMGGAAFNDLNLDLSSFDRITVNYLSNDLPMDVTAIIVTQTGGTPDVSFLTLTAPGGNSTTPFSQDFMFSSFVGSASFADVDQIGFAFEMSPSGDFALGSIEVVPEPATVAALGFGLAALAARRRRK